MVFYNMQRKNDILQCLYCEYKTDLSTALKAHSHRYAGDMFQCEQCEYTTVILVP